MSLDALFRAPLPLPHHLSPRSNVMTVPLGQPVCLTLLPLKWIRVTSQVVGRSEASIQERNLLSLTVLEVKEVELVLMITPLETPMVPVLPVCHPVGHPAEFWRD